MIRLFFCRLIFLIRSFHSESPMSHDWEAHKERLIYDYESRLPWDEILRRNQEHGLHVRLVTLLSTTRRYFWPDHRFISQRACQTQLKNWGVLRRGPGEALSSAITQQRDSATPPPQETPRRKASLPPDKSSKRTDGVVDQYPGKYNSCPVSIPLILKQYRQKTA